MRRDIERERIGREQSAREFAGPPAHGPHRDHDLEVLREYRRLKREWRERGATVLTHRDERRISREVNKELFWRRHRRRQETGNPAYKLSFDERKDIAAKHGLQMHAGRILMPDREALVKMPDGREFMVTLDAVTRSYSVRRIAAMAAAGWRTPLAKTAASRKPYGPDVVGRILRRMR